MMTWEDVHTVLIKQWSPSQHFAWRVLAGDGGLCLGQ